MVRIDGHVDVPFVGLEEVKVEAGKEGGDAHVEFCVCEIEAGALAGSFGVGHEVMFHTDSLFLVEVDPSLWEEGVWVWEYVWVGLVEYGSHADDGSGWDLPFIVEKRTIAGKALMSSNFTGTKSETFFDASSQIGELF